MEDWEARYRRKVLDFIDAPEDVDLETVQIVMENDPGYHYSEYTYEDPSTKLAIEYDAPDDIAPKMPWQRPIARGDRVYRVLDNEEMAQLINSF